MSKFCLEIISIRFVVNGFDFLSLFAYFDDKKIGPVYLIWFGNYFWGLPQLEYETFRLIL